MVDGLKKMREPVAWVVVAGLGLGMILDLVRAIRGAGGEEGTWAFANFAQGMFGAGQAATLLITVGACAAITPRTPRARPLAITGAVLAGFGTLAQAVLGVVGLTQVGQGSDGVAVAIEVLRLVAFLLVPVATTLALVAMTGGAEVGRAPAAVETAPQQDPHATTWQTDQAAGAAWTTASGAASGAQASGWGVPGQHSDGWMPGAPGHPGQPGHPGPPGGRPALTQGHQAQAHQGQGQGHQAQGQAHQGPVYDPRGAGRVAQPSGGADLGAGAGAGPQIIYPEDAASDTTQFRGRWEPNRPN